MRSSNVAERVAAKNGMSAVPEADIGAAQINVRFGSLADIWQRNRHVRSYTESGHWASPIECLPKAGWMKAAGAFYVCRVSYAHPTTYVDTSEYGPDSNVV